jgi:hypothetical protein
MPTSKRNAVGLRKNKKEIPPVMVVNKSIISADDNPFPEKLARANKILTKTKFLPRDSAK